MSNPTKATKATKAEIATIARSAWRLSLALALLSACSAEPTAPPGRVLVIGIDGATLRVAEPLMEQGRLPNLSKLAAEGAHGNLRSLHPLLSPRIWNTIATSRPPEEHGILQFAKPDEQGVPQLYLSSDRKVHALWNIVSDAGYSTAVVNWWNTYPPERIHGVMVSDHLLAKEVEGRRAMSKAAELEQTGPVVYPQDWLPRLVELAESEGPPVDFDDPFLENDELPRWVISTKKLTRTFREDGALARIAAEIGKTEQPDLMMLLLTGIDRVSHALWGVMEPAELYPKGLRPSEAERAAGRAAFESYYEYTDALIGLLLEQYGPQDLVFVISDHGFEAGQKMGFLTGIHESDAALDGVMFARGSGIPRGARFEGMTIFDITPTILAWMKLPIGADMKGKVIQQFGVDGFETVPTHDGVPVERVSEEPSGANDTLVEQLRALGYFE